MSRRRLIASRYTGTKDTHGIIAMRGLVQDTDVSGGLTYDLENELVSAYTENAPYDDNYIVNTNNGTTILPYKEKLSALYYPSQEKQLHGIWNERTRPVIVAGTVSGDTLLVASQTSGFSLSVPCEDGATKIYNLIPNETYTCRELRGSTVVKTWTFSTTGTVRMIHVDALPNVRDIGGYPCYDDEGNLIGHLKYGKIIRGFGFTPQNSPTASGGFKYVNIDYKNRSTLNSTYPNYSDRIESIFSTMRSLGVTKELDLRGDKTTNVTNTDNAFDPQYTGLSNWYANYAVLNYGTSAGESTSIFSTSTASNRICSGDAGNVSSAVNLKNCLTLVANTISDGAIWIHCKTGADRTGVLVAIIMAVCGCRMKDIVTCWELTSYCRSGYAMYLGGATNELRTFMKYSVFANTSGKLRNRMLTKLRAACGESIVNVVNLIRSLLIDGYEGEQAPAVIQDYSFKQIHLQPGGFQSGSSGYGIYKLADSSHTWEVAEFDVNVGDVVQIGVNNGTKLATFFAESPDGLVDAALALSVNGQLQSGWYDGCYEFHYSSIPLKTKTVSGSTHYYAEYTARYSGKLTVALKVNDNTTQTLGGAYVKLNGVVM